ncbi:MAG: polyphenol oxidase family protein [Spirochaetaceae bacterium]|nr:polyphenol oxidase family protein [Spirochaetaceae bacterium]
MNIAPFELTYTNDYAEFYFSFNGKKVDGARCVISTKAAGDMGLDHPENRMALYEKLGVDSGRVFSCKQTHSREVARVRCGETELVRCADGLLGAPAAILAVTVSDCLPVYLCDTAHNVFAVCHSGWKGTGIAANALRLMEETYGTDAGDVSAILGPCIQGDVYQVERARAEEFHAHFGRGGAYPLGEAVREAAAGGVKEYSIDMRAANAHILIASGVKNIMYCTNCTFTDERLGSFRREKEGFTKMLAMTGSF